ncbi:MAG: M23 family metallopeptidase [Clostridia bacterium]|nr:M23 family metallopeptidase [Clostridia bacterium]
MKYKPVYVVTLSGETIGVVRNKQEIEDAINDYTQNVTEDIAYINLEEMPKFELKFVGKDEQTSEEDVLIAVKDSAIVTYRRYAITLEGEQKAVVYSLDEAKNVVEEIKEEFDGDLDLNIGVVEIYESNYIALESVETAVATINDDALVQEKLKEKEATVNGVTLHLPLSETAKTMISSRFGSRNGGYHSGLDIATASGTPIYATASGTVTYAGWQGGYGNLVIISHGNGVETYYAHCSKIYVSKGDTVETGDLISAVGSTGNSTGPHLHLEVRINGVAQNPQNYLYK